MKSPYTFPNRDCTNDIGIKVPCAYGVSPDSKTYSYASVTEENAKNNAKSVNFYSVEEKCGESLPADYFTANRIVDLHNQYRSQVR